MTSHGRNSVFVGYASRSAKQALRLITAINKDFRVVDWRMPGNFEAGSSIFQNLTGQMDQHSLAVFLLTSDDQCTRKDADSGETRTFSIPRDNIVFEAGLFIGKNGPQQTVLVCDRAATLPSDLAGIMTYRFDGTADGLDAVIPEILGHLHRVQDQLPKASRSEKAHERKLTAPTVLEATTGSVNQLYSLSLLECSPYRQDDIVEQLEELRPSAKESFGIQYEAFGAVYGEDDDYLVFSSPSFEATSAFVRDLRYRCGDDVGAIETRHIFPRAYWRLATASPDTLPTPNQLVMASCKPYYVEETFKDICTQAQLAASQDSPFQVTHAGITFGSQDVFFLLHCAPGASYEEFVRSQLYKYLKASYLVKNQTSAQILTARKRS